MRRNPLHTHQPRVSYLMYEFARRAARIVNTGAGLRRRLRFLAMAGFTNSVWIRRHKKKLMSEGFPLDAKERQVLKEINDTISPSDDMYRADLDVQHYFLAGLSALSCIEDALRHAQIGSVRTALDMPCGYGRVLRFLSRYFPTAAITACDIDREAADFCASIFGARAAYSSEHLDFSLGTRFDLIWCGSLATHLSAPFVVTLLRFFYQHLTSNGVLVFTVHGSTVAEILRERKWTYGLEENDIGPLVGSYDEHGWGYSDYPSQCGWGVFLASPEWIRDQLECQLLRQVYFRERGWDNHQDVYAAVRQP